MVTALPANPETEAVASRGQPTVILAKNASKTIASSRLRPVFCSMSHCLFRLPRATGLVPLRGSMGAASGTGRRASPHSAPPIRTRPAALSATTTKGSTRALANYVQHYIHYYVCLWTPAWLGLLVRGAKHFLPRKKTTSARRGTAHTSCPSLWARCGRGGPLSIRAMAEHDPAHAKPSKGNATINPIPQSPWTLAIAELIGQRDRAGRGLLCPLPAALICRPLDSWKG
jgi:hypothetical protein